MKKNLDAVIKRLREAKRVLVIGHIKPDGDDISSVVTLVLILRKLGKIAEGCIAGEIPWFYKDLADVSLIKDVDDLRDFQFDTSVTVDASELSRIGDAVQLLKGEQPDITLDHHQTNVGFGEMDFYDSSYAATAVIVYEIGKELVEYDAQLAEINLLGIATDTGFFKYSNTDYKVFSYAAELVKLGASIQRISSAVLEHRTLNEVKLLSEMFDKLRIEEDGKLAWSYVSAEMLRHTGCTEDDAGGLVGEIRSMYSVEIAILFIEWPEEDVHISFRSKNYTDVSKIALEFGGGGHARAAGCSCKDVDLEEMMNKVIASARRALRHPK
ncbi:MAG: DHH family phosphoesterase [Candidatus Bipolaricaulota bacterium]|nr:DHH family phosphoesterase [Candidatus Bipolaricaulota bacterium]